MSFAQKHIESSSVTVQWRHENINFPDETGSAVLIINGTPMYLVDVNPEGWFVITPDNESLEGFSTKQEAMTKAEGLANIGPTKTTSHQKATMETAYTWERFLEVRKNHEFSPAYDSALENADLTAVELGFERHSDEWLQYFFDSYNPDEYPESYNHTSSKKEAMNASNWWPHALGDRYLSDSGYSAIAFPTSSGEWRVMLADPDGNPHETPTGSATWGPYSSEEEAKNFGENAADNRNRLPGGKPSQWEYTSSKKETMRITPEELRFIKAQRKKTAFDQYPTDRVPGDVAVLAKELKVGDVIRTFSGFEDTITVTSVEEAQQYGFYTIKFSNGSQDYYVKGDTVYYLATGPAREVTTNKKKETMKITQEELRYIQARRKRLAGLKKKKASGSWSEPGDPGMGYAWTNVSDDIVGEGYLLSIGGDYLKPFALYGRKSGDGYFAFAEDGKGNDIGEVGATFSDPLDAIEWCQNVIKSYIVG